MHSLAPGLMRKIIEEGVCVTGYNQHSVLVREVPAVLLLSTAQ